MCGLFGHTLIAGDSISHSIAALDTLAHRGPDQSGHWQDDKLFMGHRRLSIMDVSECGRQPMTAANESIILSANGEIYNFKTLKAELEEEYHFKSQSDSEVLLYGYDKWGMKGLLDRLDGMFAFVIYDQRSGQLHFARDHVGIKPLYYALLDGQLLWASELKALVAHLGERLPERDNTALYDFLTYGYIPPPKTLYQGICKLEAAHYGRFDLKSGALEISRYWQLEVKPKPIEAEQSASQLRAKLQASVKAQLMSDVPVGFFLSGGMDSSSVVAMAAPLAPHKHTYTIGFEDKADDERPFAKAVAEQYGTKHVERLFESAEIERDLMKLKDWYDEPFADLSAFPTHLVCALARESATVVLSGDGGDELFGGYNRYDAFVSTKEQQQNKPIRSGILKQIVALPGIMPLFAKLRQFGEQSKLIRSVVYGLNLHHFLRNLSRQSGQLKVQGDEVAQYAYQLGWGAREERAKYRKQWDLPDDYDDFWYFRQYYRPDLPPRTRLRYLDFHTYLPEDILTKVDRASMAVSLEVRVPILAREIVEFAFALPEEVVYINEEQKGILKEAMKDLLPASVMSHEKKGFGIGTYHGALAAKHGPRTITLYETLFGKTA